MLPDFFAVTVAVGVAAGFTCAVLIGRWGWREAEKYFHARDAIRRILPRISGDSNKARED
jgi:uncharacterized membrane protein YdjX (TVP38/TMEM64 family)